MTARAKREFINSNNLVIIKLFDNWDARKTDAQRRGLAVALGWGKYHLPRKGGLDLQTSSSPTGEVSFEKTGMQDGSSGGEGNLRQLGSSSEVGGFRLQVRDGLLVSAPETIDYKIVYWLWNDLNL